MDSIRRNIYRRSIAPHNARVMADGGEASDRINAAIELMRFYEEQKDSIKLFYFPALTGNKIRTSGLNKFVSKGYSMNSPQQETLANDLTQTTSTSQPHSSGNIAPNEIPCLENPNGGSNFLSHSPISFGVNDNWSATFIVNSNGKNGTGSSNLVGITWNGATNTDTIVLSANGDTVGFANSSGVSDFISTSNIIGKNNIITIVAIGGKLYVYVNGVKMAYSPTIATSIIFSRLLQGWSTAASNLGSPLRLYSHIIRSQALTQQQITQEYNLLRNFIPEMEAVTIGNQIWTSSNCRMGATPMGNVIAEMQAAGNVEKITNNTFSDATGWSVAGESTISGGVARLYSSTGALSYINWISPIKTIGKWYKLVFDIVGTSSGSWVVGNSGTEYQFSGALTGTKTIYFQAIETSFFLKRQIACDVTLDNIYCQEIGWTGATELYNAIYSQTSGTAAQKEYESYKAASMWCHFNNDVAQGALYGKIYNWYAIKLMQLDIDTYNAANPTTPWGWRTTLKVDWETLSATLGGDAVSGGKMKAKFGVFDNSYSNNQSGLSLISAGRRNPTNGNFETGSTYYAFWNLDKWVAVPNSNNTTFEFQNSAIYPQTGMPFRFIKV